MFRSLSVREPRVTLMRFVLVVMLSLTLMTVEHHSQLLTPLRNLLSVAVEPLQHGVNRIVLLWRQAREQLTSRQLLIAEVQQLRDRIHGIQLRIGVIDRLQAENQHLRKLLDSSKKINERLMIAEVLAVSVGRSGYRVRLNKGLQSGIAIGQPVLDANGVMGQIIKAGPFSAIVLLITAPSHALPAKVKRTGVRVMVEGSGRLYQLRLTHIPRNSDIRKGDKLVTSGFGGRFPAGYPIGAVESIAYPFSSAEADVMVKPSAILDYSHREVFVVRMPPASHVPHKAASLNTSAWINPWIDH